MDDVVKQRKILLSEREAAESVGLCPRTLFSLRKMGLPYVKVNSRVLYAPSDLEQFFLSRRIVEGPATPESN